LNTDCLESNKERIWDQFRISASDLEYTRNYQAKLEFPLILELITLALAETSIISRCSHGKTLRLFLLLSYIAHFLPNAGDYLRFLLLEHRIRNSLWCCINCHPPSCSIPPLYRFAQSQHAGHDSEEHMSGDRLTWRARINVGGLKSSPMSRRSRATRLGTADDDIDEPPRMIRLPGSASSLGPQSSCLLYTSPSPRDS